MPATASDHSEQLNITTGSEVVQPCIERRHAGAVTTSQREQMRVGDLPVADEARHVAIDDRHVAGEEEVFGESWCACESHASATSALTSRSAIRVSPRRAPVGPSPA